jgi:hypothetical protein
MMPFTTTMDAAIIADGLVNLFGAGGALIVSWEAQRADPRGPVTQRLVFALQFVALLFLTRACAWLTGSAPITVLVDILAAGFPLVALIVAEGLVRRHAPRGLKLVLCAGLALVITTSLLPFVPRSMHSLALLITVCFGVAAVALFLWQRDYASLTPAENAAIRRVFIALVVLAPLVVTDFRSLWPAVPVRLGAVGALIVLYVGLGPESARATLKGRIINVAVFAAIGCIFATGLAATSETPSPGQLWRAAAVGLAGLMFAALYAEVQGARAARNRVIEPIIDASTRAEFMDALSRHALLSNARLLQGDALDHVAHPSFMSLLQTNPVLARAQAPWGRTQQDDGVERGLSLLTAHEATHLMVFSRAPLRLAMVSVPATALDARSEGEIRVARRIGSMIFANEPRL